MSEPTSDALFGVDGTQSPELRFDPPTGLGSGFWRDVPALPPIALLPVMDDSALRKAIAAALGEDPDATADALDQDSAAAPAPQAAEEPKVPKTAAPKADVPKVDVPKAGAPTADVSTAGAPTAKVAAAPHPDASAGPWSGRPAPTDSGDRSSSRRTQVSAPTPPAPSQPGRPAGSRYRPPMVGTSGEPAPLSDPRLRIHREHADQPLRAGSNGGATIFFSIMLIITVLLLYFIIADLMNSISSFLP